MTTCGSSKIMCVLSLILLAMAYGDRSVNSVNSMTNNNNSIANNGNSTTNNIKLITTEKKNPYIPNTYPGTIPKTHCGTKLSDLEDNTRPLVRYYKYLTKNYDLDLNLPNDMAGGASAFKAQDVIQFTFREPKEPKINVVIACFGSEKNQALGSDFMRKLGSDNRKLLQVKNYALLVKRGDEKIYKTLIDSLERFASVDN